MYCVLLRRQCHLMIHYVKGVEFLKFIDAHSVMEHQVHKLLLAYQWMGFAQIQLMTNTLTCK